MSRTKNGCIFVLLTTKDKTMKNILLTFALIITTFVAQAQVVTMKIDTVQLFQFKSEIGTELALKEKLIEYKGTRVYTTRGTNWIINKSGGYVNFGTNNCPIVGIEKDQIIYLSAGEEYRIFMMTDSETGRDMVFFLEPEKDGMVRGGFGYPTNVIGL